MRIKHVLSGLSRSALTALGIAAAVAIVVAHVVASPPAQAANGDLVLTGPDSPGGPQVRSFLPDGTASDVSYYAAGSSSSGTTVAAGDVTGDGVPEIITGTGPGPVATVQVWSKDGKTLLASASPLGGFTGGLRVATANIDDDSALEVFVAAGPGGGPIVKALNFTAGQLVEAFGFYAYDPGFRGGSWIGGVDSNLVTGAGISGGPHVKVWSVNGGSPQLGAEWMAYDPGFRGGVRVAIGRVRSQSFDVATAAGPGGGPHVKLFSIDGTEGPGMMAYDPGFGGGVFVGVGAGQHLITGAGVGGSPHVQVWTANNNGFTRTASFLAYGADFGGGVRVAGIPATTGSGGTTTTTGAGVTSTTGSTTSTTAGCLLIPPIC